MYHDQGNIAQKTFWFEGAVGVPRFGDPRIRLSVSHGTAFEIAGKGVAQHKSMLNAIKSGATFAAGKGFPRDL